MWVDFDDVRAEIECLRRETEEKMTKEPNLHFKVMHSGMLVGYDKVETMLDELEEVYRKQGLEHIEVSEGAK